METEELELDVGGTPYPPYVIGAEARRKWNWSKLVAIAISARNEPSAAPDSTFVWHTTRGLYNDPSLAVGSAAEYEADLAQAREAGLVATG